MTRNLFYSTVSAGSAVLMLALLALANRGLGEDGYAALSYAITLATVAEVFMDLGLHQVTIRSIGADPTRAGRLLQTSLLLKLAPGAGMIVVFTLVAIASRPEPEVRLASAIVLVSATMRSYLLTARGILQGLERFGHDALITTLDRALLLAACGVALWHGAGVIGVSLTFLGARVVSAAAGVVLASRHVTDRVFDADLWRRLPAEALPIGVFLLVLNLYNRIDMLMLGKMTGLREIGLYGAAYPVYEGLTYGAAVVSAVLAPRLARLWTVEPPAFGRLALRSAAAVAGLALVVALVVWPFASIAMTWIFGADKLDAASTLRVLLLGLPFVYVIWILHAVAVSAVQTRTLLVVSAAGTVLNVVLNLLWIPSYAQDGAAAATVVSELVVMIALGYRLRRTLSPSAAPEG